MDQTQVKENKGLQILSRYLPSTCVTYIYELITRHPLDFKVTPPRRTKLGDFRHKNQGGRPQITINGNLNPYAFMVTTVHELAHFYAFKNYGPRIEPHGKEWKNTFNELMQPILQQHFLPDILQEALLNHQRRVTASSCTDKRLFKVLQQFNPEDELQFLEELTQGAHFSLNQQVFQKGPKRRKHFLCTSIPDQKKYIVSGIARVKELDVQP